MLEIYNTLSQKKDRFEPLHPPKVGLYVCGMTVYDLCHIGHARVLVAFDVIVRYLKAKGFEVNYTRNITDIDDKIIKRAHENNESVAQLTARMIRAMRTDFALLNVLPPTHEPKATDYITEMIELIQVLLNKGYAYQSDRGDICFEVKKFKAYGALAHQNLEKLRSGSRVATDYSKRDILDFVLWKKVKPYEISWKSPWGEGRPGWHIECSAMSMKTLGKHFDIHGGGLDLVFPHHQNEIAQSEASTDVKFVNTWIHVGFVHLNQQKMSKSFGNFFTLREVLAKYSGEVVRYFLISSHHRSSIYYSEENLQIAFSALYRLYNSLQILAETEEPQKDSVIEAPLRENYRSQFYAAMDDDFNTPEALAVLFEIARDINRLGEDKQKAKQLARCLKDLGSILGILQQDPNKFLRGDIKRKDEKKIRAIIEARNIARLSKNWEEADRLRSELERLNISLIDKPNGKSEWRWISKSPTQHE